MNTIKPITPPKAEDTWLAPKNDLAHLIADVSPTKTDKQ